MSADNATVHHLDQRQQQTAARKRAGFDALVNIPRDPQAVADVLAALIRADIRRGAPKVDLKTVRYRTEKRDNWAPPEEVILTKADDCDTLVRAAGRERGRWVGCVRGPGGGMHVFLIGPDGKVDDPCVAAGMPAPPEEVYRGAARAPIRPPPKKAAGEQAAASSTSAGLEGWAKLASDLEKAFGGGDAVRGVVYVAAKAATVASEALSFRAAVASLVESRDAQLARAAEALLLALDASPVAVAAVRVGVQRGAEEDRARILAATAVLLALGLEVPAVTDGGLAGLPAARPHVVVEEWVDEEALEGLFDDLPLVQCPGTCGT